MKYWFDTEFIEYPCTIDLISIGIVCEDGREFYGINQDCDFDQANDWVVENVLCHLPHPWKKAEEAVWFDKESLKNAIRRFVKQEYTPEFWGYYADYDWVVFCWLFGTMMDLPQGWPMYCRDIKQVADMFGIYELPKMKEEDKHHALNDARWTKQAYDFIFERKGEHIHQPITA